MEDAEGGLDAFLSDRRRRQAIERNLTIIGEAVKKLSTTFRAEHPQIDWRRVAGLRDKLIHDYAGIDPRIVWAIVADHIPILREVVRSALNRHR